MGFSRQEYLSKPPFPSLRASLIALPVKNPPAMQEYLVRFLGWKDLREKGKSYSLQSSGLENSMDCSPGGCKDSDRTEQLSVSSSFPCGPDSKESAYNPGGDLGSISSLTWKIPWMGEPGRYSPCGGKESDTTEGLHFHFSLGDLPDPGIEPRSPAFPDLFAAEPSGNPNPHLTRSLILIQTAS